MTRDSVSARQTKEVLDKFLGEINMKNVKKKITPEPIEILDKHQLAAYFGTSTKTVERFFADGLESFKIGNKRYVTRSGLNDFVNRHKTA